MATNRDSDKTARWVKAFAVAVVLAFALPTIYNLFRPPPAPTLDNNTHAYLLLLQADATGKYAEAKQMIDRAYSMTDDPKIRYLADFLSRASQIALNSGITSFGSGSSLESGVKGFIDGYIHPLDGIDSVILLMQKYFGDYDENAAYADARYHARALEYIDAMQNYERTANSFFHFSWIIFFVVLFGFFLGEAEPVLKKSRTT